MEAMDISKMTSKELEELAAKKRQEEQKRDKAQRDAYEGIRAEFLHKLRNRIKALTDHVADTFDYVKEESEGFKQVMAEYGQLRFDNQLSFTVKDEHFKAEVKVNKIKAFDERADIAAARLIDFLKDWIAASEKGVNDPMYQLGMTMIERNRQGDLDYKSISKLYQLESEFNSPEYSEIMQLFKESNVTETTATNFYFWERDNLGVWRKLEPNFNRL